MAADTAMTKASHQPTAEPKTKCCTEYPADAVISQHGFSLQKGRCFVCTMRSTHWAVQRAPSQVQHLSAWLVPSGTGRHTRQNSHTHAQVHAHTHTHGNTKHSESFLLRRSFAGLT